MQICIRYEDRMEQIKEMENMYNEKNNTPTTGTPTDDNPKSRTILKIMGKSYTLSVKTTNGCV